jgi:hypothetical protein
MNTELKVAVLGMIPGNGHPYSWSAIINGYDRVAMEQCPYAVIPEYLNANHSENLCVPKAQVTHIWTDDLAEARLVAKACLIKEVVNEPEQVIGEVDAIIIATDDGTDHVRRARPFIEAGLPVFIDKPMATSVGELRQFIEWKRNGARILSSSGMRYAPEIDELRGEDWNWLTGCTCKTWDRYGIHILEPLQCLLGSGFTEVSAIARDQCTTVSLHHRNGTRVTVAAAEPAFASFGVIHAYGAESHRTLQFSSTYTAFRNQLLAVVDWFHSNCDPFPFDNTIELMAAIIAANMSSANNGRSITLKSVLDKVQ